MTISEILQDMDSRMRKANEFLTQDLAHIRTGRASPALLENIRVDYFGVPTPLNQLATISIPEARLVLIQPWDRSIIRNIEKAILKSDLGLNPITDSNIIRIIIPPLTEERRKELIKAVQKRAEDTKVALRNIRRDSIETLRQAEKNKEIAERLFSQIELNNVKRVLEVGCGIGKLSAYLVKKYKWEVTGIDLDPEQVERARKDNKGIENLIFLEADATRLPFEDSEFDIVLSFDVLHHIPDWNKALEEISRVLKPKGFYILNDLAFPEILVRIFKNYLKNYFGIYAVDDITGFSKRVDFEVAHKEKPNINILMRHFNVVFMRNVHDPS